MNEQIVWKQLTALGLADTEIFIYLHLLKSGPKTPLEISREININRSKIYRLIEMLLQKKLIERSISDRGLRLKASPPANLELLLIANEEKIKDNREALPNIIQSLSYLTNVTTGGFEISHYKGIDGLKQMLWNELKAKEVMLFGYGSINDFVGKKFGDKHREEAFLRKIKYKEIGNRPEYKSKDQSFYNNAYGWEKIYIYKQIPEKILKIRHGIQIYNDTVAIINWQDKHKVGIEIINRPLAEMQRQIFCHFWKIAS